METLTLRQSGSTSASHRSDRYGKIRAAMPSPEKAGWEKSSPGLVALFDDLSPAGPGIAQKKMFGWPCCFLNGNLFAGLHKENILFRLSPVDLKAFLALQGAAEFEPMPGRKMTGYGILSTPLDRDRRMLAHWISRSLEFARLLPPKESKKPAKNAAKPAASAKPGATQRKKSRS